MQHNAPTHMRVGRYLHTPTLQEPRAAGTSAACDSSTGHTAAPPAAAPTHPADLAPPCSVHQHTSWLQRPSVCKLSNTTQARRCDARSRNCALVPIGRRSPHLRRWKPSCKRRGCALRWCKQEGLYLIKHGTLCLPVHVSKESKATTHTTVVRLHAALLWGARRLCSIATHKLRRARSRTGHPHPVKRRWPLCKDGQSRDRQSRPLPGSNAQMLHAQHASNPNVFADSSQLMCM